jgi:hypothetical protein
MSFSLCENPSRKKEIQQHPSLIFHCENPSRKKFSSTPISYLSVCENPSRKKEIQRHPSLIFHSENPSRKKFSSTPISYLSLCENPSRKKFSNTHLSSLSVRKPLKQETQQHPSLISLKTLNKKFSNTHLCACENPLERNSAAPMSLSVKTLQKRNSAKPSIFMKNPQGFHQHHLY